MKSIFNCAAIIAVSTAAAVGTANADMGLAPSSQNGIYVSFGGGYLLSGSNGVIGYGRDDGTGTQDVILDPRSGWFADAMAGYAASTPFIAGLPFTRVELYGIYGRATDSASDTAPPNAGLALKNDAATLLVTGGDAGFSSTEHEIAEGGLSFKADSITAGRSLTFAVTPFVRWIGEDTITTISQCCTLERDANVDTWLYGLVFAVEPEAALTSTVSIVGRLGAGVYGYRAHGTFVSFSNSALVKDFDASFSESDSGVGFRGQLGVGLKIKLAPGALMEAFTEADYFSDTGTGQLANNLSPDETPSHLGSDHLWELRAGARLTLQLGQ